MVAKLQLSTPLLLQEQSKPENYPPYMAPDGENFRGLNAVRLLSKGDKYT
jgi:hypothetical protein